MEGAPTQLRAFLATLGNSESSGDCPGNPPWFVPGVTCRVDRKIYAYFAETIDPKWKGDRWFIVGQQTGPFRLFWQTAERTLGRELTCDEARRFADLTGMSLVPWYRAEQGGTTNLNTLS
jgi:hypothetical protein